jgi:hypothetical protein
MALNFIQQTEAQEELAPTGWAPAVRDDTRVARAVVEGEPIDAVYTLEDEAAFDELLRYANTRGFVALLEQLANAMRVTRVNVPPIQHLWLRFT